MLALLGGGDHVAGGEAGEHQLVDLQVEALDHVDQVREPLFLAVDGPVADLEPVADEVEGAARDEAAVDAEGAADVVDHGAAERELLGLGEFADRGDVAGLDEVVGRLHVDGGLVVEALEVAAALGEEDPADALAGVAFRLLEGGVRAVAGRAVIDHGALDDPAGGDLGAADDGQFAAGVLADEDGDLGCADLDGTDVVGA